MSNAGAAVLIALIFAIGGTSAYKEYLFHERVVEAIRVKNVSKPQAPTALADEKIEFQQRECKMTVTPGKTDPACGPVLHISNGVAGFGYSSAYVDGGPEWPQDNTR